MARVVALCVTNCQIFLVAATALAARLNVLQSGLLQWHMLTAYPAWHLTVQLAGYGFVDFQTKRGQGAHGLFVQT
jgi:hypothetical protein